MLDCLLLGDSIAVGVQQHRPNCALYAEVGINSSNWNNKYKMMSLDAETVVISLGTNDHLGVNTRRELNKLRSRIKSKKVYWIMPAIKPNIQKIVEEIANKHKDVIVKIPSLSKDGYHPSVKGYKKLGEITQ